MKPQRDRSKVKVAGALSLGIGTVLMLLTLFASLFTLFTHPNGNLGRALLAFGLMIIIASTLMSCGLQLTRLRLFTNADVQAMRLNWTALMLMMVVGGLISFWLVPQISDICVVEIVILWIVRGSVIRLSG